MKKSKTRKWFESNLEWLVPMGVAGVCAIFLIAGHPSENGKYITLDGSDAQITEGTKEWIESMNEALARIMNKDQPTDAATIAANNAVGQGFYTTIDDILGRVLPDGNNDGGVGFQCSRYTAYLGTGQWSFSNIRGDYGPVNGKDVAEWLVKNYGFKYIDKPVRGAIGSGGFNTLYGHTVLLLNTNGSTLATVNDANYIPLTVATHNMDITGYRWVVPGNYEEPKPQPETPSVTPPEPAEGPSESQDDTSTIPNVSNCQKRTVRAGDTMGAIMEECGGVDWSRINQYADSWYSTIVNPGRSVYWGWTHGGVGLYAGDIIEKGGL